MSRKTIEQGSVTSSVRAAPSEFTQDGRRSYDLVAPPNLGQQKKLLDRLVGHLYPRTIFQRSHTYDSNKYFAGLQLTPSSSLRGIAGFQNLSDALGLEEQNVVVLEVFLKPEVDKDCNCIHTLFVDNLRGKILARGVREVSENNRFRGISFVTQNDQSSWTTVLIEDLKKQ